MAIFGKLVDILGQTPKDARIQRGLGFLKDYEEGRLPPIVKIVRNQKAGECVRWDIDGDKIFATIQCYEPFLREQGKFEAHRRYIDLQYICEGCEWIEVADREGKREVVPYDGQKDVVFYLLTGPFKGRLLLRSGDVAILYPTDLHAPCLRVDGESGLVRKIVVKVTCGEKR